MNEIEKMYKLANVKAINIAEYGSTYIPKKIEINGKPYPPFTTEKQLELTQKLWELRPNIYPNFDLLVNHSYGEMIATFVNNLWQDLTEQEKEQIKEILE